MAQAISRTSVSEGPVASAKGWIHWPGASGIPGDSLTVRKPVPYIGESHVDFAGRRCTRPDAFVEIRRQVG